MIDEEIKTKIEEIIGTLGCPKDFQCFKSGFKKLCKVKGFVSEQSEQSEHYVCLNEKPPECKFSFPFEDGHFCQCPLRVFIFKELGK